MLSKKTSEKGKLQYQQIIPKGDTGRTFCVPVYVTEEGRLRESDLNPFEAEVKANCIKFFHCFCRSRYVNDIEIRRSCRQSGHVPKWTKNAQHLDRSLAIESKKAFHVVTRQNNRRLLRFVKAPATRNSRRDLCEQLHFMLSIVLP